MGKGIGLIPVIIPKAIELLADAKNRQYAQSFQ